jgi:hypothetical protein
MVLALIDAFLALPEDLRADVCRLLMSGSPKPNSRDLHSPAPSSRPPAPPARARHRQSIFSAKTAERKLLAAMRDNPGLSVIALANAVGSSRSATGERLRQLALRGLVEKDATGRWKLREEEPRPTVASAKPGPSAAVAELTTAAAEPERIEPTSGALSRWIKPLSCYERRETTVVEGLRYGLVRIPRLAFDSLGPARRSQSSTRRRSRSVAARSYSIRHWSRSALSLAISSIGPIVVVLSFRAWRRTSVFGDSQVAGPHAQEEPGA